MQEFDLAILGAGCAGRSLATMATEKGYRCIVIECRPASGHASVRNQGWLHSGALYAAINSEFATKTIEACREGADLLRQYDQSRSLGAIGKAGCLMVYQDEQRLKRELQAIESCKIFGERIARDKLYELEPVLGTDTVFVGGIRTLDTTVNTVRILNELAEIAYRAGCVFHVAFAPTLSGLKVARFNSGWLIEDDGLRVQARVVVCACGTQIPSLVNHLIGATLF